MNDYPDAGEMPQEEKRARASRPRLKGDERQQFAADLKKKYEAGASIRALVEESGRSYGLVHRLLLESGAAFHPHGGYPREGVGAFTNQGSDIRINSTEFIQS